MTPPSDTPTLRRILDSLSQMVCRSDADGRIVYANAAFARLVGSTPDAVIGRRYASTLHADDRPHVVARLRTLTPEAPCAMTQARLDVGGAAECRHIEWTHCATFDEGGVIEAIQSEGRDITEHVRADAALARSNARARFLAEASAPLVSSLDLETMLWRVARAVVPFLADGCTVTLFGARPDVDRVAIVHREPEIERALQSRREAVPLDSVLGSFRAMYDRVARGETVLIPELTREQLERMEMDEASRAAGLVQRIRSLMVVPLHGREGSVGSLALTRSAFFPGPPYGEDELELAVELGRRAGLAIENAWLHSALKEQDQRKDTFVAVLAHELRNPLAALQHAVEVLGLPSADPASRQRALAVAQRQVRHQARMIDDLLDVSRLTRGAMVLQREAIDLEAAVREVADIQRPFAEAKGQRLVFRGPQTPLTVEADPARLQQIVGNLLDNAIKFAPRGGLVRVSVGAHGEEARIEVHDNGPGMTPALRDSAFEPFVQGPDRHERPTSGLGIGLTIAQELVLLHDGHIEVLDAQGGTTVRVTLPRVETPTTAEGDTEPERPSGLRILVIDDNVDAADMLASLLEAMGHEARTAQDGEAGLTEAFRFRPHLTLVDLVMPRLDGYETVRALRADPRTAGSRIVALSGHAQDAVVQRALAAGFDQHEAKPIELTRLSELLAWAAAGPNDPETP